MQEQKVTLELGGQTLSISTGKWAKLAGGSAVVRLGDTVVLVAASAAKSPTLGRDFVPLTVDYRERTYAAGKIPGGFFKREGRPTEKETLSSRLIDRPVRTLFYKDFPYETQIMATVMSSTRRTTPTCWPWSAPRRRCACRTSRFRSRWAVSASGG